MPRALYAVLAVPIVHVALHFLLAPALSAIIPLFRK